nr:alpha/beta hydrolase-fold protein [uncultured Capnocytophaga sp.]
MKKLFTLLISLLMAQSILAQISNEVFTSGKTGKRQKLGIYKPAGYSDKQTYPLIIVLNGNTLMEPVVTAVRYYEQFQEMPKCIVVGVFDESLEDVAIIDEVARPMNESARFFEFISTELVPYVQGKFPIAGLKGIVGSEEAGFLINYYLLNQKNPFNMFVSLNPTAIPRMGQEFSGALAAGGKERLFYYMTTADVENKLKYDKAINFERSLRSMPTHESVDYHFVDRKGTSINAAKLEGIAQAFDLCFDIYKPIGGKEYKTQMETLSNNIFEYLETKYKTIDAYLGIKKKPLLNDIMATYTAIKSAADWESLKKLAKYVEDNGYVKTAMPNFFLAEYYEKTEDYKKALKTYQKSYTEPSIDFITADLITERINALKTNRNLGRSNKKSKKVIEEVAEPVEEQVPTDESNQN